MPESNDAYTKHLDVYIKQADRHLRREDRAISPVAGGVLIFDNFLLPRVRALSLPDVSGIFDMLGALPGAPANGNYRYQDATGNCQLQFVDASSSFGAQPFYSVGVKTINGVSMPVLSSSADRSALIGPGYAPKVPPTGNVRVNGVKEQWANVDDGTQWHEVWVNINAITNTVDIYVAQTPDTSTITTGGYAVASPTNGNYRQSPSNRAVKQYYNNAADTWHALFVELINGIPTLLCQQQGD